MPDKLTLRASAMLLAAAGGIEYGLQMAMPIMLVRFLDPTSFGQYRMLWLLAGTALALGPMFMPQALFYFLPRAEEGAKRRYIVNVLLYLTVVGALVVVATSPLNPWLPDAAAAVFRHTHGASSLFVGLWTAVVMLDVLPTSDGHPRWQARATVLLSVSRTLLLGGAAYLTGGFFWLVMALVALALIKLLMLLYYIRTHHHGMASGWDLPLLKTQLRYALPFAVGTALYALRVQADDWVVATMLTPATYAVFSIAGVVLPVASLIRQPVYNAMMPTLNRAHSRGDLREIARLIGSSNGATAMVLIPVAGGLLAAAPDLIEFVYTRHYRAAAPAMQYYLLGMMMNAFSVGHVLPAIEKGRFAAFNNAGCLLLSIVLSIVGVRWMGFTGAAIGSVLTFAVGEGLSLWMVARTLKIPIKALLQWQALVPVLIATGLAIVGTIGMTAGWEHAAFLVLVEKGILYLAIFAPVFLLTGGKRHLGLLISQYR